MKKFLLSLAIVASSLFANAEGAGWYFVYDGNSWATNESTEFQTTATPDVYLLANYPITADAARGGLNYQITNKGWATMYGWCAEADGNDVVGKTYKLGHIGNAWLNCESGSYDITFNAKDETILFQVPASSGINDIAAAEATEVEYYSIAGIKVNADQMHSGLYIKKQGSKVSKVIIK